jgi:crotonobetainyl-CoA:carnitine CoA-transferase CaiB-like acyl-CoA transferase
MISANGTARTGPLNGVRVLDLTEHMAGPYCTMILGDMGAEVIKLERPGHGDSSRGMGDGSERNPYFRYINRNKKGVTLDYKTSRGREIFLRLVREMDVLVENYRATVMERAGLAYEVLRDVNPRLIYAQLSGFGSDGPYREKGGVDLIAQGMGGIMHVTGEPDGPPTSVGLPICDLGTGMWGAHGVLAALYQRTRPDAARRSSARCWRQQLPTARGRAPAGSPISRSPCVRGRATDRTPPTSALRPRTRTS